MPGSDIYVEMFAKIAKSVTLRSQKFRWQTNVTLMIIHVTRNHISHEIHYVAAARLMRGWLRGPSP